MRVPFAFVFITFPSAPAAERAGSVDPPDDERSTEDHPRRRRQRAAIELTRW